MCSYFFHSQKGLFRYGDEGGDETGDETGDEIGDEISALEKHRNLFLWPELCIAFGQPFWHTILVF